MLVCSPAFAGDFHLSVGLGLHDPALDYHLPQKDAHGACNGNNDCYLSNPLGIVKLRYQSGKWEFGMEHISSIPNTHDSWGITMAYVQYDIF